MPLGTEDLRIFLLVPALFMVLGGLFAYLGVARRRGVKVFKRAAVTAPGVVTAMRSQWKGGGGDSSATLVHFPTVRFSLPDGRLIQTELLSGSSPAPAKVGQQVTVHYLPNDPTRARIDGFWADGTLVNGIFVVMGTMFFLTGAGVLAVVLAVT